MKNKAFTKYAAAIWIIGLFMMYFYSGLQNDHLNILTPYVTEAFGMSNTAATNPVTIAGFVVIPATVLIGTLFIKLGVVKTLVPCTLVLGLSCIGLGFSGGNMVMYSICLFLVRLLVTPLQMGGFMLCTNWFVSGRGRTLGFITIGSPLCTATLIAGLTWALSSIGFAFSYTALGVIVIVMAIAIALFIKDRPEQVGLFPDGADHAVTVSEGEEKKMTLKEVMANKNSWLLIVSFGFLQFCIVAIMAFYVPRLQMTGTEPGTYLFWLSVAAIIGMPISYILGWIDDKFGTVAASIILSLTFILALCGLLFMSANNIPLIVLTAIGIAGLTGGTPNLHPSMTAYVYGRENYQAANRWIMAIQAIIMAFAIYFMSGILDATGSLDLAYQIMIGMVVVAAICLLIIGRTPDFDRGKAKEKSRPAETEAAV